MTDRLREVAKEVLNTWAAVGGTRPRLSIALNELSAALAEQDAEPILSAYQRGYLNGMSKPRREWQSLTDEEIDRAIETALRAKNGGGE